MHRWLIAWFPTHVGKKETEVNHVESSVGDHVRRCENKKTNIELTRLQRSKFRVRCSAFFALPPRAASGLGFGRSWKRPVIAVLA